ncbi:hypothetical protein D3C87_1401330 [compost metagenome]
MKLLVAMVLTVFSLNAVAGTEAEFYDQVRAAVDSGSEPVELNSKDLTEKQRASLLKAAQEEANIWYDTILEGDYALDPDADLNLVAVEKILTSKGAFVAYRISFAHAAFDTGSCETEWDYENEDQAAYKEYLMNNCTAGHISSSAYVSPDFEHHFRDEDSIEDFQD